MPRPSSVIGLPLVTLLRFPDLGELLPDYRLVALERAGARVDAVAGWGRKLPARWARHAAARLARPFFTLEDGFLRSVGLGKSGAAAVSVVMDDLGVYYDARTPSRLEHELARGDFSESRPRATALREEIVHRRLTKYNHLPDRTPELGPRGNRRILLVEQVAGDMSIAGACADRTSFAAMLADALAIPSAQIIIRSHPDVMAGRAQGSFTGLAAAAHLRRLDDAVSPHAVLDEVDEVWTVSSQLGFDALLRGLPVRCYGVPFYAGWGLSEDQPVLTAAREALARRRQARIGPALDVVDLVDAALIRYPLYADPITGRAVGPEQAIARLQGWRAHAGRWRGETEAVAIKRHKRPILRRYCAAPGGTLRFSATATGKVRQLSWGLPPFSIGGASAITVEDGFLRSVGLGFPGTVPISLCFDASGIYYDATAASDLETLLETGTFPAELTERAARLRQAILQAGLTKYNLSSDVPDAIHRQARGRRRVLVVGQVPGDQSLRLGLPSQASNLEFLQAVRHECPDAFIVFKEHPDLVAGKRPGLSDRKAAGALADHLAVSGDAAAWIDFADEVHVRTSLTGFEALLRNRPVICHGAPFFAGWGLTTDRVAISRRRRRRSLDELVAAALILYPTYLHPVRGLPMEAEDAVAWLSAARQTPAGRTNPLRRIIRWWPRNAVPL
ncbi:capsular polysaccharide biosynthesis protein [Labrys sp. LIt4]|uniref:capsular polysaccharide biosynthesis protein n=1 Tax=Labrys sp. LIt4 TaxID=2821355 RepID=UPI001ADF2117|nr:capsular polysaccharide biosynthesis protein [Labrys sp. LIt4]MBP0579786.1 capsular polysaccharide biosynthesis protein [Labrys sp. LIt4]